MTIYQVVPKNAFQGTGNGGADQCCVQPPCCSTYPLPIQMPTDLVDPACRRDHADGCGDRSVCVGSYWGLPYWWTPWWDR